MRPALVSGRFNTSLIPPMKRNKTARLTAQNGATVRTDVHVAPPGHANEVTQMGTARRPEQA